MAQIAALVLKEYQDTLQERAVELSWTDAALKLLAEKAEGARYGARQLRKAIRTEVEDPLAERATEDLLPPSITIDAEDGKIVLRGL